MVQDKILRSGLPVFDIKGFRFAKTPVAAARAAAGSSSVLAALWDRAALFAAARVGPGLLDRMGKYLLRRMLVSGYLGSADP